MTSGGARIRFCPHCGKDYPWSHRTCDHCGLLPLTLDKSRRTILEHMQRQDGGENWEYWEWSTGGDEEVCATCAPRDGLIQTRAEVEAILRGAFCTSPWCRCAVSPVIDA